MIASARQATQRQLTQREMEVLALAAAGLTHKEIAMRLGISAKTARNHLANLYGKLGIHVRTQAVAHAVRLGLVEL
ncbi:MAG TPA: LuxR C-terminal-related transcriptional regulator [Candidatus Dormibacteraeota bacterium]|nr:LuxR C-terminal-related transcriptional regulator [Candidatus Dormibacteraeota bacterium]